ncbi:MAG: tetratricopeptide repeat protein [Bryobacteraceae bacterium]
MPRVYLDYLIAVCICLVAAGYWMWDSRIDPQPENSAAVIETRPIPKDPFNDEGYRLFSAADYPGAEAQFRKAIAAQPKSALAYCNLGAALIALRKYDAAIAALQTARALDPSLSLAGNNLNWALVEKAKAGQ